jgi:Uma2 family endonuclease
MLTPTQNCEKATTYTFDGPMTFDEFVSGGASGLDVELIDGSLVEREVVNLEHEKLFLWLITTLGQFVEARSLGRVLGSRTPVRITSLRGRLPDILFVRSENEHMLDHMGVRCAPDLVIELLSPSDRPSDTIAREADYTAIQVREILFVDQRARSIKRLLLSGNDYTLDNLSTGSFSLASLPGVQIVLDQLFSDPRPDTRDTVDTWLSATN